MVFLISEIRGVQVLYLLQEILQVIQRLNLTKYKPLEIKPFWDLMLTILSLWRNRKRGCEIGTNWVKEKVIRMIQIKNTRIGKTRLFGTYIFFYMLQGVQENHVFSQFSATPPSPTSLLETFKALNAMRVYSHYYWLVFFCTTNSSRVMARERWQTLENFRKKHNI